MGKILLNGQWEFKLDKEKRGIQDRFFEKKLEDSIHLPGTTATGKKGEINQKKETGCLTEVYPYEGYAWYGRTITFHEKETGGLITLKLERTRISYVWIDSQFVGSQDSLCTAHNYDLTKYITGTEHRLTIMVSNTDYPIPGGHMTSPDTQTNWNGILGDIVLDITKQMKICDVQYYPDAVNGKIEMDMEMWLREREEEARVLFTVGESLLCEERSVTLHAGKNLFHFTFTIPQTETIEGWNEFEPKLYLCTLKIITKEESIQHQQKIGFRTLRTKGREFYLDNLPVFFRGKHDGMVFPLTGYAPMEQEVWRERFHTAKKYGINHYRFHTCCPPKAAFEAADELGIYLEPELLFWGTIYGEQEEGYDERADKYLIEEGYRILKEFGNHPSFLMFSLGNELWGNIEVIERRLHEYKEYDNRHWYTQGSNDFQFAPVITKEDDFFCNVRLSRERLFRGSYAMCDAPLGHVQTTEPENCHSYDAIIMGVQKEEKTTGEEELQIQFHTTVKTVKAQNTEELVVNIPIISHEVGQYQTYPDYREIEKYTGVLRAENLSIFKRRLEEAGLGNMAERFFFSSGKLAADCYKRELETAFRSRELSGFQLLDLQDFPGQGTALVGILNAFMENKGIITASEFRKFCSDRVFMLSFPKYIYRAGEKFSYQALLYQGNPQPLMAEKLLISLIETDHKTKTEKVICQVEHETGSLDSNRLAMLGEGYIELPQEQKAKQYRVDAELVGTDVGNHYEITVYPEIESCVSDTIVITEDSKEALGALAKGKKVLLIGTHIKQEYSLEADYCTDFWCYQMFSQISENMGKPKPIGTLGLCMDENHSAFAEFPVSSYTTPCWWKLLNGRRVAVLDTLDMEPIVWAIDNVERNHRLGFMFEASVGEGKLFVCQGDLQADHLEAKWLRRSILQYMESDCFAPTNQLPEGTLQKLYD